MTRSRAPLIVVDGIDGVGKSTQIQAIAGLLQRRQRQVLLTRDPGSSEIGSKIREILLETRLNMHRRTEAMLFMASRCEMVETVIRPALQAGTYVVSDRFLLANVVYQSVGGETSGVTPELLWRLGTLANGGLRPDLTVLLDMPAASAIKRLRRPADRMESRGENYLEAVRQAYLRQLPHASDQTLVVDADRPIETVTAALEASLDAFLDRWQSADGGDLVIPPDQSPGSV
jgi:dTMP kinase